MNSVLVVDAEIAPDINTYLSELQASHIFHIAHEALANTIRHGKARKVTLRLIHNNGNVILQIQDDGVGFKVPREIRHGHRGLANIQQRALTIGANLSIKSDPANGGTSVTLTLREYQSMLKRTFKP